MKLKKDRGRFTVRFDMENALISKADYWSGNANYRDFEKIG